ncbi:MAG: hypothetical protein AAGA46_03170 [Cyanobacteria bacterium P01_F01_bin.13]
MRTETAPKPTQLSEAELKDLFDRSFEHCHADIDTSSWFDLDVADEDLPAMPDVPLDGEVALQMLERKVTYWEHLGWVDSCDQAIFGLVYGSQYAKAQAICQWLLASPPKGLELVKKDWVKYAAGQFPVDAVTKRNERMDYFLGRIKANRKGTYKPNPEPIWRQLEKI